MFQRLTCTCFLKKEWEVVFPMFLKDTAKLKVNVEHLMILKNQQNILHTCITHQNDLYRYAMARSFPSAKFKWLDPANFSRNKYDDGSLRPCVLEANLEYPKELHELFNNYSLALVN